VIELARCNLTADVIDDELDEFLSVVDDDASRLDDKIQSSRFPLTAPIDEAVPRQCPP
jgi:hypothetical protein